ncbi:hypothetical protein ElyMa_003624900 [Elysia marginata]|uniref:Uncharacterized protein n=1 Tax=Elysia marginata TaxID=1093978 RepID=A0AAV4ESY4_9GAST|nr:hypothetical protein ElyMa_003624900 [Elysia marginata]
MNLLICEPLPKGQRRTGRPKLRFKVCTKDSLKSCGIPKRNLRCLLVKERNDVPSSPNLPSSPNNESEPAVLENSKGLPSLHHLPLFSRVNIAHGCAPEESAYFATPGSTIDASKIKIDIIVSMVYPLQ